MQLLFLKFIYSSLLFKIDFFCFKRAGRHEIKPGDGEKNISCLSVFCTKQKVRAIISSPK